jgi:4-alpha-glucanotransferase
MTRDRVRMPPFTPDYRGSGILLHVTSLPSPYGIGDIGPAALSWIDLLSRAGQGWWQVLPLGPIGYGNSPYQPLSSFAGNAVLISPDWLIEDGLLRAADCAHDPFPPDTTDYDSVIPFKSRLIEKAWDNFRAGTRPDLRPAYDQFCIQQDHWLGDYALFRALKVKFNEAYYLDWPDEFIQRKRSALDRARIELAEEIQRASFTQFLFLRQAERLRAYAREKGVQLMGDLPFFVSPDSSDVWADPELFLLDSHHRASFVAGVPPDYFSAQGQLWGNPLYDWDRQRQSGYRWWVDRLSSVLSHVDSIRLDHFRAFAAAWHVPAGAPTAQTGQWVPGPGADFFHAVQKDLSSSLPCVAEDLGMITPDVYALRDQFHFPGMRILQFAFDGHSDNPYLPENYVTDTVVYSGTHDNPTTRGWFENMTPEQQAGFWREVRARGAEGGEAARALMELGWSSIAALAMVPLQDLLDLGPEARMNVPGDPDGNWRWRCTAEKLEDPAFEWLSDLTIKARRSTVVKAADAKAFEAATTD